MYGSLLQPDLRLMLLENDEQGLKEFCEALLPPVAAEVLEGLPTADVWRVLDHAPLEQQVEILEYMTQPQQIALVDDLYARDRRRLTRLIEEMAADDRVDLLAQLDPEHVEVLLPLIAHAERTDIRKLLSYPEGSAGAIMTTDYASLPEEITVRQALEQLRRQAPDRETIYYVYILDESRRLDGFISLRELILARPDAVLRDIMKRDVVSVPVASDREFVAQEMGRFDFLAIPVVDEAGRLVGIVTYDDVLDIVQEEATEDAYRAAAVEPLEESYLETPVLVFAWKRGMWLLFLAVMALVTAHVIGHFNGLEGVARNLEWMAMFLPLVLGSGGNAGSQSATLVIRTMALGEVGPRDALRIARREIGVGCVLGTSLSLLGFAAAKLWFGMPLARSCVLGLTVFLVVVMGTVNGALLPLLFRRLGMDPALMSNPLIAALCDMLGVIIFNLVAISLVG